MPKKHQPSYASIKPTSAVQTPRASSSNPPPPQSVNERIQQLRREQAPRATSQRRDEVTEPGTRTRTPLNARGRGQRPPPGPAAPSSWLERSRHAPAHVRNLRKTYGSGGFGPSRFCKLATAHDKEYKRLPLARSLAHQCLRTFALHWEELVEYEQHYLPTLPVPLKEALLSYLSLYGNRGCLDFKSLKILFRSDEVDGASGSEDVRFLDLTGLLNERYTLKDMEKSLQRPGSSATVTSGMEDLSISSPKQKEKVSVEVADSWEDAAQDANATAIPTALSVPIFPNLTRLSIAHPGPSASWSGLLSLSVHLNTLTHLSLAYWPRPSTTPNAATTSMVSRHTTVSLGGSHFYSDLDDDWHEAANILRRLSLNTYCLKWLDLEGCTWLRALTWNSSPTPTFAQQSSEEWTQPSSSPGPDWNAAWRQIEYINLFQGWIPTDRQSLQNMPAGVVPAQLMRWLRENESKDEVKEVMVGETGHAVAEWVEREKIARSVGSAIQSLRKAGGGKWCVVDHGWGS